MTDQQRWPLVGPTRAQEPADSFADPGETDRFVVLVEEVRGSGESQRWAIGELRAALGTRADAQRRALDVANTYEPRHPVVPQSREVYRLNPDSYLVVVQGLTTAYHFRVSVGERL